MKNSEVVVIFDLFGVVFSKGLESSIKQLEATLNRTKEEIAPVYRKWELEFDLGHLDEQQFWANINLELRTNIEPGILSNIVLSGYKINHDTLRLARRLRPAFQLVTFSNYRREWFIRLDSKFHVSDHFSRVFISSDIGLLKPDPRVLSFISAAMSVPTEQLLLIDDESENVKQASQTGCRAILFRNVFETEVEIQRIVAPLDRPYDEYYSGIIIQTVQRAVVMQRRDDVPSIANPGMLTVFGGRRLPHEDPRDCALRELTEETALVCAKSDLELFSELSCPIENDKWMHCSFFLLKNVDVNQIKLEEGECIEVWQPCEVIKEPDVTPVTKTILTKFCKSIGALGCEI